MADYQLATVEGRGVMLRPAVGGKRPQVQVAILSKRGNIMEAVTLEVADVLGFCAAMGKVGREASARFDRAQELERVRAEARHAAALARNPWLAAERTEEVVPHET